MMLGLAYRLGYGLVGQQHKLLDELVGILRHLEVGRCRLALLVDVEVQLLAVELHGAVLEARCAQLLGQGIQLDELCGMLALIGILLRGGRGGLASAVDHPIVLQYLLHLLVGIAAVAAYDGVGQVPSLDVGILVEHEDDAVAQLVLIGAQRADVVAQPLGQHGDGAVYQIDARGAVVGLLVDGGALADVVAHVCNMHAHLV